MLKYCPGCQIDKYANYFHKHRGRADGLQPYCKECKKEVQALRYSSNQCNKKINVIFKKCSMCAVVKHSDDFYKHRNTNDGLQTYCKACDCLIHRNKVDKN